MSVKIPVHIHLSRDYHESQKTHYTIVPVSELTHSYTSQPSGARLAPINCSCDASELLGYIIAPDGTEAFTVLGGMDVVRMPGDAIGTELCCAMDYAQRKWDGLGWEPARPLA